MKEEKIKTRLQKRQAWAILMLVTSIFIIITGAYCFGLAIDKGFIPEEKKVNCYDKYGNKIIGLECREYNSEGVRELIMSIIIMGMGSVFLAGAITAFNESRKALYRINKKRLKTKRWRF